MTKLTEIQQLAIDYVLASGAEQAARACDLDDDARGLYSDENDIIAYGVMPNTNETGWYFAGYADEIVARR